MIDPRNDEDWQARIDRVWEWMASPDFDEADEPEVVRRIDAIAAERPDDPIALFERAGARDSTGDEAGAEQLYRAALRAGLPEFERGRATIQLASTLRNLDRADESVSMLREYFDDRPEHPLASAAAAFLALSLNSVGQKDAALATALRALAPTLPRYQRAARAYADELVQGGRG